MACFVPDSNVFLQCRSLDEVDWAEVTADASVELIVVAQVYRELDRLKQGGNARRARRARAWVERLRPIALGRSDIVVVRERNPRVVLRVAPRLRPGELDGSVLDLEVADERIVAEALAFAKDTAGRVTVLSDDGMAVRAAADVGLPALMVPLGWRAEPEPDEGQRRVAELERQMARLVRQSPVVHVRAVVDGVAVPRIEGTFDVWPELSPAFIAHAMKAIRSAHPGPRAPRGALGAVIAGETMDYGQANYDNWLRRTEQRLASSARLAFGFVDPFVAQLVLENTGGASADGLVIDVLARGDIRIVDMDALDDLREKLSEEFPAPPKPRSLFGIGDMRESLLGPLPRFPMARSIAPRGVSEFDWSFDTPAALSTGARGECTEFRHGLQPEAFAFGLRPPLEATHPTEGALVVRVSARNLGTPQETVVPVALQPRIGDTEGRVAAQLAQDLDVAL
jgi:hypothetical protein